MCAGMPLWMPSFKASGRAPSSTTWTVTSWSLRKTSRSLMRSSASAGAATESASAAATIWLWNRRARIRRTGHYSVANARQPWQIRDGVRLVRALDRGETGRRHEGCGLVACRRGDGRSGSPVQPDSPLDREDQLEVEGVAAVACDHVRAKLPAEQRQIAEQIQNLVANELVLVAEAVQRAAVAEHDGVIERSAARQAVLPHETKISEEAVGAGRGVLLDERPLRRRPRKHLRPDRRVVVVERVADAERVRRHEVNPPSGAPDAERTRKREHPASRRLLQATREREQAHEGLRASVEGGDLRPVHLDLEVVDPETEGRRHEVLDRLNAGRIHPQGGRVMGVHDALRPGRDPFPRRAHLEHDARVGGCRGRGHPGDFARVKADALDADWLSNGVLAHRPNRKLATRVPHDDEAATI